MAHWLSLFLIFRGIRHSFAACSCTPSLIFASPTKPIGTTFGSYTSATDDPLGPWNGQSVGFEGTNAGDLTTFDYLITCTEPCYIIDITIEGIAWWTTTLSIYNSNKSQLLGQIVRDDQNSFTQYIVPTTTEMYLTKWRFTDTTPICCWRYRHSIIMNTKTLSETFSPTSSTTAPTAATLAPTQSPITPISLPVYSNDCDCTVSVVSASPRYPTGTSFSSYNSDSENPLAVFIGKSVGFQGTNLGDPINADYLIDCNIPCWIKDITIEGIAWFTANLTLYDGDKSNILGTILKNDGNSFQIYIIDMSSNEQYLTQFRFIEVSYICCWRYRHLINITAIPKIQTTSGSPTRNPSFNPSINPTNNPSFNPTSKPSVNPSSNPSSNPTINPSPLEIPTFSPTDNPSNNPSVIPSNNPSTNTSLIPMNNPTQTQNIINDGEIGDQSTTIYDGAINNQGDGNIYNDSTNDKDVLLLLVVGIVGGFCLICCITALVIYQRKKNKKYDNKIDQIQKSIPMQEIQTPSYLDYQQNEGTSNQNRMKVSSFSGSEDYATNIDNNGVMTPSHNGYIDDNNIINDINDNDLIDGYGVTAGEMDDDDNVLQNNDNDTITVYDTKMDNNEQTHLPPPPPPQNFLANNYGTPGNKEENVNDILHEDEFIIGGEDDDEIDSNNYSTMR